MISTRPISDPAKNFLMEEIKVLEEAKCIGLPNFIPRTAFLTVLHGKVRGISSIPVGFIDKVWDYLEGVMLNVLMRHTEHYELLQKCTRRAGRNLSAKMKEQSIKYVMGILEMEKLTDCTCNPEYISEYNRLMAQKDAFMKAKNIMLTKILLLQTGEVGIAHLIRYPEPDTLQAFDLKMRITAYWKVVLRRLIDNAALHLQFSINSLVNKELKQAIINDLMGQCGGGIESLLVEAPSISGKRERINRGLKVLRECKEVVANIMDEMSSYEV